MTTRKDPETPAEREAFLATARKPRSAVMAAIRRDAEAALAERLRAEGSLTKHQVAAWLERRAQSYEADAMLLEAEARQGAAPDPTAGLGPEYRHMAAGLRALAAQMVRHGPLPPLPSPWRERALSGAAKCPDWPAGCGEQARKLPDRTAVLRHREGCAFWAAEQDAMKAQPS